MVKTVFSRCPVGTATEYLIRKGTLREALRRVDAEVCILQEMDPAYRDAHYTQTFPLHFRDGGNIPPLWAQSKGDRCVLLGVTYQKEARGIYVRTDSDISCVEELKGRKLALPVRKEAVIDFRYFTALCGFEEALAYYNLSLKDTEPVFVSAANIRMEQVHGAKKSGAGFPTEDFLTEDFLAVEDGRADAAFANSVKAVRHDQAGLFRNLLSGEEQAAIPNKNNNAVLVITCTKPFAYAHPEIVRAYLRELVQAGIEIGQHRQEFLETTAAGVYGATAEEFAKSFDAEQLFQRIPELTDKSLALLEERKEFLIRHKAIAPQDDYDLAKWADVSFIRSVYAELGL